MLAYLFWHIPIEATDPAEYEARLLSFHESLAADPPSGFHASAVFRHYQLPWAPSSLFVYEDWYVLDSFAALGRLNQAATAARHKSAHDAAAGRSGWGAGGVYAPRTDDAALSGGFTYWFSKPDGVDYDAFYSECDKVLGEDARARCWQRQLVLGPAPEFCVLSESRLEVDALDPFESVSHVLYSRQAAGST